jgi:Zn-dependent protease with chaperone function
MSTKDVVEPARSDAELQRQILNGFHGAIEPIKVPLSYRLGILLVAVVMIILPLIYIAIIGFVGFAVYYHAVNHTDLLKAGSGRGKIFVVLVYLAPMVIGGILILFMLKPLLSRPAKRMKREPLSPGKEPLLFAFVDRLCEAVNAPKPKRIELDEEVNASASFSRGFLSMLGNDLVLTIGLPLVSGLNMRQFAGVLAHEFGHFSQGAGMRLTYVIRSISHWFTRVVYERDQWDEKLVDWSQQVDLRIGWILYLARVFVWITRKILWVLMMVGHAVSGFMLRQMEFDADRHEARLAGSDVFESTSRSIFLLSVAAQGAQSDLGDFYQEGRLCDNLPKLILHNYRQFTPDVLHKLDTISRETTTGWLDTHPCDTERIASAKAEHAPGIFQIELPASVLFADFDRTCQRVTWDYYQGIFGSDLSEDEVHPVDDLLLRLAAQQEAYRALHRYFQGTFRPDRPLRLSSWDISAPEKPNAAAGQVKETHSQIVAAALQYATDYSQYAEARGDDRTALEAGLTVFERMAGQRLTHSLQLLHLSKVSERIGEAEKFKHEITTVLPILQELNQKVGSVEELQFGNLRLAEMFERLSQEQATESDIEAAQEQMRQNTGLILKVRDSLTKYEYPYDHAKANITVGEFALATLPDSENPGQIYEAAGNLIETSVQLRARLTGHLCQIAEQVERVLGLKPLPEPPDEDDK